VQTTAAQAAAQNYRQRPSRLLAGRAAPASSRRTGATIAAASAQWQKPGSSSGIARFTFIAMVIFTAFVTGRSALSRKFLVVLGCNVRIPRDLCKHRLLENRSFLEHGLNVFTNSLLPQLQLEGNDEEQVETDDSHQSEAH